MFKRFINTTKSLIYGRKGISPNVDLFLENHGDERIIEMIISRNEVSNLLVGSLKLISLQFRNNLKNDKLYHLKLLIRTTHSNISLEKNEGIFISPYHSEPHSENMIVKFQYGLTLNILLENTREFMGNKFTLYSAKDNNCQNFILSILESNKLANSQNILFTKQSTTHLFSNNLRKLTNTVTDIASKVDIVREGGYLIE